VVALYKKGYFKEKDEKVNEGTEDTKVENELDKFIFSCEKYENEWKHCDLKEESILVGRSPDF
jgi:hypothetical protein